MAKQDINYGAAANDRTGDSLREAFRKSKQNFDELYETTEALEGRIINGAATDTDPNGNPTPSPVAYPPANYVEGTLFFANAYPAAVDEGAMVFRQEAGAWVWRWGSFRASNGNGNYHRFADGRQECEHIFGGALTSSTAKVNVCVSSGATWTYPATFAAKPAVTGTAEHSAGDPIAVRLAPDAGITTSSATVVVYGDTTTSAGIPHVHATGKWAA